VEKWMRANIPEGSKIEYYSHLHYAPRFPKSAMAYRVKKNLQDIEKRKPDYVVLTSSYYYRFLWDESIKLPKGVIVPRRFLELQRKNKDHFEKLFNHSTNYRFLRSFTVDSRFFGKLDAIRLNPEHIIIFKRINLSRDPMADDRPFDVYDMFYMHPGDAEDE
jgi:hypothetical protein